MSSAIVVIILVAAGEANSPATTTITAAAAETLGPTASFVVRESASPSDNEALKLEDELHANAVVEIVWSGTNRTHAMVRLHVARMDRWVQRELTFLPADNPRERSRTIGFALASMLFAEGEVPRPSKAPDQEPVHDATPVRPDQKEPRKDSQATPRPRGAANDAKAPAPVPGIEQRVEPGGRRTVDRSADQPTTTVPEPEISAPRKPRPPSAPPPKPFSADLVVVGSPGFGRDGTDLGGAAHIQYFVGSELWLAGGLGVRSGFFAAQSGYDLELSAMAGGLWRPLFPTAAQPFEVGIGAQVGISVHQIGYKTKVDSIDTTLHGHGWVPGGQVMLEGGYRLDASWELVAGVGLEITFSRTEIQLQEVAGIRPVGEISIVRGLAAAGLRLHF